MGPVVQGYSFFDIIITQGYGSTELYPGITSIVMGEVISKVAGEVISKVVGGDG